MKQLRHALALFLMSNLLLSSCSMTCLPGEGAIITEEIDLDLMTGVTLDTDADVVLKYGKNQKVEVTAHANHLALLNRVVSSNTWEVDFAERVCSDDIKITVTLPLLEHIAINGSGDITSASPLQAEDLNLDLDGSGRMDLDLSADGIELEIDGSGEIILRGNVQRLEAELNGSGILNSDELSADVVELNLSGSGDAEVHANDRLDISLEGSGSVSYSGNPSKVNSDITGSGEIKKN